jgi:peptide/nickel transport system permease protein
VSLPRPPLGVALCLAVLAVVVACALTGALLAPHDPAAQDLQAGLQGPSASHLLGTDDAGRDVLSRLVAGTRTAVVGPLLIALGAAMLGSVLGLSAGYRGGWADALVMRGVDLLYAVPFLLVAIVVVGVLGGGYLVAVLTLTLLTSPYDVRIVRGAALAQRSLPYVDAARTLGLAPRRIMFRHVWPNVAPLVVANGFLNFASSLVTLSALSFLGLGVGPGAADWGRMLADDISLIEANPVAALAPGAALVLTATCTNLVGDWLFERLADRGRVR